MVEISQKEIDFSRNKIKEIAELKLSEDAAMKTNNSLPNTGGIDFNSDKMNLETRVDSRFRGNDIKEDKEGIKFTMDPAMLEQLKNAPGFTPVIINIQPMTDLRGFLGLNEQGSEEKLAKV